MVFSDSRNRDIVLICHNVRSCHNVGSLLRTADGLGVHMVYFTGYTPYPIMENDPRLPHIATKNHNQIKKTSLGAENYINWVYEPDIKKVIKNLKDNEYEILGLEQSSKSINVNELEIPTKMVLIVGNEIDGIDERTLDLCNNIVEIPMLGKKESFNIVQATAMCLYHCRYT